MCRGERDHRTRSLGKLSSRSASLWGGERGERAEGGEKGEAMKRRDSSTVGGMGVRRERGELRGKGRSDYLPSRSRRLAGLRDGGGGWGNPHLLKPFAIRPQSVPAPKPIETVTHLEPREFMLRTSVSSLGAYVEGAANRKKSERSGAKGGGGEVKHVTAGDKV